MAINTANITDDFINACNLVVRAYEKEVDDGYLNEIERYVAEPLNGLCPDAQKYAERGMHQLQSSLHAYEKSSDPSLWRDYLDASYAELFLGVTPKAMEPAESCYLNDERVLYAEQFFEIKKFMEKEGFTIPDYFKEPADHIAMEMRFLTWLLEQERYSQASSLLDDHLNLWVTKACDDIIDRDDVGFYTGVANLNKALIYQINS